MPRARIECHLSSSPHLLSNDVCLMCAAHNTGRLYEAAKRRNGDDSREALPDLDGIFAPAVDPVATPFVPALFTGALLGALSLGPGLATIGAASFAGAGDGPCTFRRSSSALAAAAAGNGRALPAPSSGGSQRECADVGSAAPPACKP
jgi:hypothetical protein